MRETNQRKLLEDLVLVAKEVEVLYGINHILVSWNNRLRSCAARIFFMKSCSTGKVNPVRIELSWPSYVEFGYERLKKAYLHELAHQVAMVVFGEHGHTFRFKEICERIGGTMNRSQAGKRFAACATDEFLRVENWEYTCPGCGHSFRRSRRYTFDQAARRYCKTCKTYLLNFSCVRL